MSRRLIPLLDRVLIQKVKPAETSSGGILLPASAQSKINSGKVIAVGPGRRNIQGDLLPLTVKVGDEVLLSEAYNATEVEFEGEHFALYREDDLLGILEKQ